MPAEHLKHVYKELKAGDPEEEDYVPNEEEESEDEKSEKEESEEESSNSEWGDEQLGYW